MVSDRAPSLPRVPSISRGWLVPLATFTLVAVLGSLSIHGSSIGIYDDTADDDPAGLLYGRPRPIRSDEWFVRTPWVIAQDQLGLPDRSSGGVGSHDAAIIADLPVEGWEVVIKPHLIPYRLFDGGQALAFEWWILHGLQFLGVYALLLALTKSPGLSSAGGLLVTLSPITQWWTGPGTYTTIGYASLATALTLWAYRSERVLPRSLLAIGAGVCLGAFAAGLYVPWQVTTMLVTGAVALAVVGPDILDSTTRRHALVRLAQTAVPAVAIGGAITAAFLASHREAIETIASTVYPGQRTVGGGGVDLRWVLSGPFDLFASAPLQTTVNGTNQSENSSGMIFAIPVAAALITAGAGGVRAPSPSSAPLRAVLGVCAAFGAWALLPLPSVVGAPLLLNRVPPERVIHGLAFGSVIALILAIDHLRTSGVSLSARQVSGGLLAFAVPSVLVAVTYGVGGVTVNPLTAAALLAVVAVGIGYCLQQPNRRLGLTVLVIFSLLQASQINPLQVGVEPITDARLSNEVRELAFTAEPETGWVVFSADRPVRDELILNGLVTATGVNHVSGVSPFPDHDAWRTLDPEGRYENAWNRYGRVSFVAGSPGTDPIVELSAFDAIQVTIDPCDQILTDSLNVGFVV
ncbi:MAG: DUF7657 domain-containing protein, partial [Acidimicrobiales bacterium]